MIQFKSFKESTSSKKGQSFDYLVKDYVYNSDTKLLSESPTKKDIFAYVNSFASSSLDAVLDKYSNLSALDSSLPVQSRESYSLDTIAEAFAKAEDYRESRGLSVELSIEEVYQEMLKEAEAIKNKVEEVNNGEKKAQTDPQSE